jgi:hypothetical protein
MEKVKNNMSREEIRTILQRVGLIEKVEEDEPAADDEEYEITATEESDPDAGVEHNPETHESALARANVRASRHRVKGK